MNFLLYIDPGTGSVVIQSLIAFFLGIVFFVKTYWPKIKNIFTKLFKKELHKNISDEE